MPAIGKKLFRAEVETLGNISHVNLVQLRGFCAEGVHRLLVYEYLENGSLDKWIFCDNDDHCVENVKERSQRGIRDIDNWDVRYQIAIDTARGLQFLHEGCRDKVLHLDVKPQNILLDGMFRAKLSDFGLSKLIERERRGGHMQTQTTIRGTPGYIAPEWFLNLPVTEKNDVFGYGMVLLDLVTGRKNEASYVNVNDGIKERYSNGDSKQVGWYFPSWVVKQVMLGNTLEIIDKRLLNNVSQDDPKEKAILSLIRLIHVAFWCIQENPISRPSMSTIVLMLEGHVEVLEPPLEVRYIPRQRIHLSSIVIPSSSSTPSLIFREKGRIKGIVRLRDQNKTKAKGELREGQV